MEQAELDKKTIKKASPDNLAAFQDDLEVLINTHCMENGSDTPDFMLAAYLTACMVNFNTYVNMRQVWSNSSEVKT